MKRLLVLPLLCAVPALVQAAEYKTDADHTFVYFEVLHNRTSTLRGRFDTVDGDIAFDRQAKTGQARIRVDMKSISTGSRGLDEHLLSADFFQAGEHPEALFESTAFRFEGDLDRKSTRLNSSHVKISYAVFCLKKKRQANT